MVKDYYCNFFDRCVVVNLPYRKDRLQQFHQNVAAIEWPFREIEIVRAVHGDTVGVPDSWTTGGGSYGCMRSHSRILEDAMMDKLEAILIMEDDAVFRESFAADVTTFLNNVPTDWDCLMIGGQHIGGERPTPVREGIVRCCNAQRTHCFALRGRLIRDLYRHWQDVKHHCDWAMGPFCGRYKTYAPDPFIVGQAEGQSDINGRFNPAKFWSPPKEDAPVIWFRNTTRSLIEELRTQRGRVGKGFHFGYDLNEGGEDRGLADAFAEGKNPREVEKRLRQWMDEILWESAATVEPTVCSLWHTRSEEFADIVRKVCGGRLIDLNNPTEEQAVAAWRGTGRS